MNFSSKPLITLITLSLSATSAYAINGDLLIGLGAKSRGMAGLGIAKSHGAESTLVNPAMLTELTGSEISLGGTIFIPKTHYDSGQGPEYSTSDLTLIPEVSIAHKINDNFYVGIGMWGSGGLGADYRESGTAAQGGNGTMQMVTSLQLMKFGVPLSYALNGMSVGITPIIQYGALDINYKMPTGQPAPFDVNNIGEGTGQDFGFGFNAGFSYDLSKVLLKGLKVGAVYKSAIGMKYKGQISAATKPFAPLLGSALSDKLTQPAESGLGVSYKFLEDHTLAFDYKKVHWEDANGYAEFGWKDQDVYILGYEYEEDTWAFRTGLNYAKAPLREYDGSTGAGAALNMLNLLGFPVNIETHYSMGGTYHFNNMFSVDLAFVYATEQKDRYDTSALVPLGMSNASSVRHSQYSYSFQLNYNF